ncbi:MAG: four helix bundle protein [Verrucomicrobiota bacterium]
MKYERFEDVPVWQDGAAMSADIFLLTEDRSFKNKGDIADQLQRAGLSVPNNISEGFERGTTQELITYLYYARGSAGEVRSILHVMDRLPYFKHLGSQMSDLRSRAESVARQLRGWADSLQNTEIKGHRYLNEKTRRIDEQKKRAEAFLKKLKDMTRKPEDRSEI